MEHDHDDHNEPVSYGVYVLTWVTLLVLTSTTVTVAGMNFGNVSVFVALIIAAIKATVVLYLFMHLKYESRLFHIMLYVVLVTLVVFIGLTFTDILFR